MNDQIETVAQTIAALELSHPVRIGIDGFCAAGKTTVASALATILAERSFETIRICTDDFQHPPEIRWQLGENSPEGFYRHAIDFGAMRREVLEPLGPGGSMRYRTSTYDIRTLRSNLSSQRSAPLNSILILDGLFLHDAQLEGLLDFTVFVQAPFEACILRARARNQEHRNSVDEIEALYRTRYIPGYEMYLEEARPAETASVTITNTCVSRVE